MAGQAIGRFQIIREIGRGAAAVVYEAQDTQISRPVAIKVLSAAANLTGAARRQVIERFYREARSAGKLSHPNIAQIYDVGEDSGRHYIAMELCQGVNLRDILHFEHRISETRLRAIAMQILSALEAAHAAGIVHRDIKPENIVVGQGDRIKLTDFGIAKLLTDSTMTQTGMMLGTPAYMSPEQVLGKDVDARSDLFSLGAVLYECLSGHKPFQGDTITAVTHKIAYEDAEPLTGVMSPWPAIVMKALCKAPSNRYQCATDMLSDVRADRAPVQPPQQMNQTINVPAPASTSLQPGGQAAPSGVGAFAGVHIKCSNCGNVFGGHLDQCPVCSCPVLPTQRQPGPPAQPTGVSFCPRCGGACPSQSAFCPACGQVLSQYSRRGGGGKSSPYSTVGIVLGLLSLFLCPPLFGVAGIVLGAVGMGRGEPSGCAAVAISVICMVIGMAIGLSMLGGAF